MIDGRTLPLFEPIYTFVAKDGTNTNVASNRLRLWCAAHKHDLEVVGTPVNLEQAKNYIRIHSASPKRVWELIDRAANGQTFDPIIYGHDGSFADDNGGPNVILIDGHHRYVLYAALNIRIIPSYILTPTQWEQFIITNLPDITAEQLEAIPLYPRTY